MLKRLFSKDPLAAMQVDLDKHMARRAELAVRLDAARASRDAATAERRDALVEGRDADALTIERRVIAAEREAAALADAVTALDDRIEQAGAALATAERQAELDASAKVRVDAAGAINGAAVKLERAVETLAAAFAELVLTIPERVADVRAYVPMVGVSPVPLEPEAIARAILAQGMWAADRQMSPSISQYRRVHHARAAPRFRSPDGSLSNEIDKYGDEPQWRHASGAAAAIIADRLRAEADAIRAGTMEPREVPPRPVSPPRVKAAPQELSVVFKIPVRWREAGRDITRRPGGWSVPEAIAERAIAQGVGYPG